MARLDVHAWPSAWIRKRQMVNATTQEGRTIGQIAVDTYQVRYLYMGVDVDGRDIDCDDPDEMLTWSGEETKLIVRNPSG